MINNEGILTINMRKDFLQTIIHISHKIDILCCL